MLTTMASVAELEAGLISERCNACCVETRFIEGRAASRSASTGGISAALINEANVPESKIYPEILKELKKRKIITARDVIYADRGYYSYENYVISVREFRVVPLIFPRKNCNFKKLFNMLKYPLKIFDSRRDNEREIKLYKGIIAKFKELISKWKEFRSLRSIIEDIFKLAKKAYSMEDLHRYTRSSVQKYCSLAVLLVGITLNYGIRERKELQAFAE